MQPSTYTPGHPVTSIPSRTIRALSASINFFAAMDPKVSSRPESCQTRSSLDKEHTRLGCCPGYVHLVQCMYTGARAMARRLTTAQARRDWAKVLRSASRGTPVVVTSNGKPVAAVVSIDQLRSLEQARLETLSEAIRRARSGVNVSDLQGPDPWANVRDPSTGRNVDLD